jgi:hypothetical protein
VRNLGKGEDCARVTSNNYTDTATTGPSGEGRFLAVICVTAMNQDPTATGKELCPGGRYPSGKCFGRRN